MKRKKDTVLLTFDFSLLSSLKKIVWDDPTFAPPALRWAGRDKACPPKLAQRAKEGTPDSKFAGGHRIRVTPVPIPNTEVKPDTADGTAWETVWESRSLPAVILEVGPAHVRSCAGFFVSTSLPCLAPK